jgi:hypothetical protein
MCVVSAVSDYYRTSPFPLPKYVEPLLDRPAIPPAITQDPEALELLRRAVEILDRLDKRIGDLECNDAAKAAFLETLGANLGIEP